MAVSKQAVACLSSRCVGSGARAGARLRRAPVSAVVARGRTTDWPESVFAGSVCAPFGVSSSVRDEQGSVCLGPTAVSGDCRPSQAVEPGVVTGSCLHPISRRGWRPSAALRFRPMYVATRPPVAVIRVRCFGTCGVEEFLVATAGAVSSLLTSSEPGVSTGRLPIPFVSLIGQLVPLNSIESNPVPDFG
jgi:hypothetical protein